MRTQADIIGFIDSQPQMTAILAEVASLNCPDCWVGAGFLRNAVWDALHSRPWSTDESDIDVVYFDATDVNPTAEARLEEILGRLSSRPWSVKNQARMHHRNGDGPYLDTQDAVSHWLETCTAVAVRRLHGRVDVMAPFGWGDLLGLIIRPTPSGLRKPDEFQERVTRKRWLARWPKLRLA
jgi:hypothetical protein